MTSRCLLLNLRNRTDSFANVLLGGAGHRLEPAQQAERLHHRCHNSETHRGVALLEAPDTGA